MNDPVRFYLDEQMSKAVAHGIRARGLDVVMANDVGMRSANDMDHLSKARQLKRVIVTKDTDFLRLHATRIHHAGIIYLPRNTSIGETIRGLDLIFQTMTASDFKNTLKYL